MIVRRALHRILRPLLLAGVLTLTSACGVPSKTTAHAAPPEITQQPIESDPSPTPTTATIRAPTAMPTPTIAPTVTLPPIVVTATIPPTDESSPSAARDQIAYVKLGNIYLFDLGTGQSTQLTKDGQNSDPAWSPDGARLAFTYQADENTEIMTMRADGSDRTLIKPPRTTFERRSLPTFAPDGTFYFIRRPNVDTPPIEIVRRDDAGKEVVVHSEPGGCGPTGLSVGPDGRIALSLDCGMGWYTRLITPPQTETQDVGGLIAGNVCATGGVWAHSLPTLAVVTAVECAGQDGGTITTLNFATQPPRITELLRSTGMTSLSWSPDDRRLVFARDSGEQSGLYVINSRGGEPQRVLPEGTQPAWRPRS